MTQFCAILRNSLTARLRSTGARAVLRGDDAAAAQVLLLVRADRRLAQRDEVRGPLPLGRRCATGTRLGPGARSTFTAHDASSPPSSALSRRVAAAGGLRTADREVRAARVRRRRREGDGREQGADASRTWSQQRAAHRRPSSLLPLLLGARPRGAQVPGDVQGGARECLTMEGASPATHPLPSHPHAYPFSYSQVRENACQGFCNDQCPAGSKKQVMIGCPARPPPHRAARAATHPSLAALSTGDRGPRRRT